jgi:hypothetical protein
MVGYGLFQTMNEITSYLAGFGFFVVADGRHIVATAKNP